jgi:hypothetical protein
MKSRYWSVLGLSAMLALQACGNNDDTALRPYYPQVPNYVPQFPNWNQTPNYYNPNVNWNQPGDYFRQYLLPQFQIMYGNLVIQQSFTIGGIVVAARTYTWIEFYEVVMIPLASGCACLIPGGSNYQSQYSVFAALNFDQFYVNLGFNQPNFVNNLYVYNVFLPNLGSQVGFYYVFNMYMYYLSGFWYQVSYRNLVPGFYYPVNYAWPLARRGNFLDVGFNYNSGSGLSIGIGGGFSW